jgi:peroxiredoxin
MNPMFKGMNFAVLAMALMAVMTSTASRAAPPKAGDAAPEYVGQSMDGETVSLRDHPGKAIVVSYWATWCPVCLKELPILANIEKAAGKANIQVIAVNTESRDVFRKVSRALHDLDLQLAYDPDRKGQRTYGVTGIPHMVIIGRDGRIEAVFRGYGESQLDRIVAAINRATGAVKP